jgi:hypothetical protein
MVMNATTAMARSRLLLSADGGFDAVQDPLYDGHIAVGEVDPGKADEDEQRRQDEQHASGYATPYPVHQPADVGGQLLRLRPRQDHGVVKRMQETVLGYPAALLHQFLVHHADLPGGAAEADKTEFQPVAERLPERDRVAR